MKKTFIGWLKYLKEKKEPRPEPRQKPRCICNEITRNGGSGHCSACNTIWV